IAISVLTSAYFSSTAKSGTPSSKLDSCSRFEVRRRDVISYSLLFRAAVAPTAAQRFERLPPDLETVFLAGHSRNRPWTIIISARLTYGTIPASPRQARPHARRRRASRLRQSPVEFPAFAA